MTIAFGELADQAAGLRRLLRPGAPRTVALCSAPQAGRSVLCASLAASLAAAGRRVLVLDCAGAGAGALLGAGARPDLLDAARAGFAQGEFVVHANPRVAVVRAHRTARALGRLSAPDRERLVRALDTAASGSDCVLLDTAGNDLALAAGCSDVVLVVRADRSGLLDGYRMLKRCARLMPGRTVLVVMNRVKGIQSQRFFGNLSATARQFLGMSLEFVGEIPEDESLQRASSLKQPAVEVFPASPAARAVRGCALGLAGRDSAEAFGAEAFVARATAAARAVAFERAQA